MTRKIKTRDFKGKVLRCPLCHATFGRRWNTERRAWVLHCDMWHCRIALLEDDPFVGRWEEQYAKGEKIFCLNGHEMRFFCTSTGFVKCLCPVKTCMQQQEMSMPDRVAISRETEHILLDKQGDPVIPDTVDRPVAAPDHDEGLHH